MKKKLAIPMVASILVSAAALYFAFYNVPFADLLSYLGSINYWWIIPATGLIILSFVFRVFRWRIILENTIHLKFLEAFHPLMIGFMMNCILPARIGELARPVLLKKNKGVPMTTGLATVAAERVFDVIMMIVLFAVTFSTISARQQMDRVYLGHRLNSDTLVSVAWGMVHLGIAMLVFIALLTVGPSRRLIKNAIAGTARMLSNALPKTGSITLCISSFIINIIDNFSNGLSMVKKPAQLMACALLTGIIWGITVLSYVVFAKGCPGINLSWIELTTFMVIICFFIALPSVPGFWGLWEAAGVFALSLFGVIEKDALGFTLVNHATQIFPIIIIGLISALITSANIWQISKSRGTTDMARPSSKGA